MSVSESLCFDGESGSIITYKTILSGVPMTSLMSIFSVQYLGKHPCRSQRSKHSRQKHSIGGPILHDIHIFKELAKRVFGEEYMEVGTSLHALDYGL